MNRYPSMINIPGAVIMIIIITELGGRMYRCLCVITAGVGWDGGRPISIPASSSPSPPHYQARNRVVLTHAAYLFVPAPLSSGGCLWLETGRVSSVRDVPCPRPSVAAAGRCTCKLDRQLQAVHGSYRLALALAVCVCIAITRSHTGPGSRLTSIPLL